MSIPKTSLTISFIFFCSMFLFSCAERRGGEIKTGLFSNFLQITDNEDKGVKEVLDFYGGYCKYSIGTSASSKDGTAKYFELELSKSDLVEQQGLEYAKLTASNTAYLFYKNLKDESSNYNEIHVVLKFEDGQEHKFEYTTSQLALVEKRLPLAYKVVETIKLQDFNALLPLLNDSSLYEYDKNALISRLAEVGSQFGNITDGLTHIGFVVYKAKDGRDILYIAGIVTRDIQSHEFSLELDLNSDVEEVFMIDYSIKK